MSLTEIQRAFGSNGIRDYVPVYGRLGAITDNTRMMLFTAEGLLRAYARAATKDLCHPDVEAIPERWLKPQALPDVLTAIADDLATAGECLLNEDDITGGSIFNGSGIPEVNRILIENNIP